MEEKEILCAIPRNLNKPDTVINSPVKLNWKQITYIGAGIGGAYLAFQTGLPHVYKITLMAASCGVGIVSSMVKYEDSTLDELAVDGLHYLQRKNIYKQLEKRSELVVNINARKEEITASSIKPSHFTISTAKIS